MTLHGVQEPRLLRGAHARIDELEKRVGDLEGNRSLELTHGGEASPEEKSGLRAWTFLLEDHATGHLAIPDVARATPPLGTWSRKRLFGEIVLPPVQTDPLRRRSLLLAAVYPADAVSVAVRHPHPVLDGYPSGIAFNGHGIHSPLLATGAWAREETRVAFSLTFDTELARVFFAGQFGEQPFSWSAPWDRRQAEEPAARTFVTSGQHELALHRGWEADVGRRRSAMFVWNKTGIEFEA